MGTTELSEAGVRAGDEVVLPAYGGDEAATAVRALGALPVLVDIDPRTFCMDPAEVEAAVTERTAAIAAVHLFGHPADMTRLRDIARRRSLRTVEFGTHAGRSPEVPAVDAVRRRQHAAYLDKHLRGVVVPFVAPGAEHVYTEYVVRILGNGRPDRDAFRQALRARGVRCHVPVKQPLHRLAAFRKDVRLPESERAADECLALPVESSLTRRELHRVAAACNSLGGLLLEPAC